MKKLIISSVFAIFFVFGFIAVNVNKADAYVSVGGYYRSNGTYVQPYVRSSPNALKYDNYSYTGGSLYNDSYYSPTTSYSSNWYTPSYYTDSSYYTGKSLYDSNSYYSSYTSPSYYSNLYSYPSYSDSYYNNFY
ncbi:MAG: hypothetical protein NTW62_01535 [Candidatus Nomurabacteria bacterium]|nr:hypothetical protein [Candidatus Nomurabacteria bacterium]